MEHEKTTADRLTFEVPPLQNLTCTDFLRTAPAFFTIYPLSFPSFHSLSHTPLSSQVCLPPTQKILHFHYITVNHCILVERSNL